MLYEAGHSYSMVTSSHCRGAIRLDSRVSAPVLTSISISTRWRRANGRPIRKDKAISQQYLNPQEEKVLTHEALRMARNGHPWRVKHLPILAQIIARQRSSASHGPPRDHEIRTPSKNWAQWFLRRNPELRAKRLKAIDLKRHGPNIYEKVAHWFSVIEKELQKPDIVPENVYNMDETGYQLSAPVSVKVLVSKDDLTNGRGVAIKRESITAIECICAGGSSLPPLIVWPALTHRSSWTTYPTPDWHFAVSKTGYVNTEISLYWIREVFDPWTRTRANGKPRVLINDGFATHESVELQQFCFENNIILCRLPSHTSHKLQPCDVGVFGPLKAAYREQVDHLYRGGANTVGKEYFTLLYSRAREKAFTSRNIRSGWLRAGLFPFNPGKVLHDIPQPQSEQGHFQASIHPPLTSPIELTTPVTSEGVTSLCRRIGRVSHLLDDTSRQQVEQLKHAAQRAIAGRDLLSARNDLLLKQNDEKIIRQSAKSTVIGTAKVMSYQDLMEARQKRETKEAERKSRSRKIRKRSALTESPSQGQSSRLTEVENEPRQAETMDLEDYCSVLQF